MMLGMTVSPISKLSPALGPLWRSVHDRLSAGRPVHRVKVGPLTVEQQEAIADLLGSPRLPGDYATVSLRVLDEALQEAAGATARQVVEQLLGTVGDRAGDRSRAAAERTELWAWLASHPVVQAQPALADWMTGVRRQGVGSGSVPKARDELERVLRVLAKLPAAGVPLPVFADSVLGETHAMDDGQRCAGLVLKALAAIYDLPQPTDTQERRALWGRAGIADDELSPTVLVAGCRADGRDVASRIMRVCADAGQAAALTLKQVRSSPDLRLGAPAAWVFENPSLLALALDRFGDRCPPMICTSGWPSSVAILLLQRLASAGTTLHYHGDFDGEGLRIAANIVARTGALPWRMSSADYLAAVSEGPPVGRVTPVPWDEDLAGHLTCFGTTVAEERVAPALLDELAAVIELQAGDDLARDGSSQGAQASD